MNDFANVSNREREVLTGQPRCGMAPTTSIIISNSNYGHFIAECIKSALNQSQLPDEVIVVDDGSTDGSRETIAQYSERVTIIFKANGGQASAINAGFARSSGEVVFFVDADDLLRPEAIETVTTNWHEGLTSISFGLELIDADGRSRGLYDQTVVAAEGDNRPELLERGTFPFAPTSGNAFNRNFLSKVLPMDEARWRISADAFLLKAAALDGRMAVIRHVLGAYRTHGGNNYFRESAPEAWRIRRGVLDMADALTALAGCAWLPGRSLEEKELIRLRLRFVSLELRRVHINSSAMTRFYWREFAATLLGHAAPRDKFAAASVLGGLALGGWQFPTMQRWLHGRRSRPPLINWALQLVGYRRLEAVIDRLQRRRFPELICFGELRSSTSARPLRNLLAEGWSGESSEGLHWSSGSEAALEFLLDPSPKTALIEISVIGDPEYSAQPIRYTAIAGDHHLLTAVVRAQGMLRIELPLELRPVGDVVRIVLSCAVERSGKPWHESIKPEPRFAIVSFQTRAVGDHTNYPYLATGPLHEFALLLPSDPKELGWRIHADGVPRTIGFEANCRLSVSGINSEVELILVQPQPLAMGWLRLLCNEIEILSTQTSSDFRLFCRLPPLENNGIRLLNLKFIFVADDPVDDKGFGLEGIGLNELRSQLSHPSVNNPGEKRYVGLNVGRRISFDRPGSAHLALGFGWDKPDQYGVRNTGLEASITFNVTRGTNNLRVQLDLESQQPEIPGRMQVVGVGADGKLLASVHLIGAATIEFPLETDHISPNGNVLLTLHSLQLNDGRARVASVPATLARVALLSLSILGNANPPLSNMSARNRYAYQKPKLKILVDAVREALAGKNREAPDTSRLAQLRAQLASFLSTMDVPALKSSLSKYRLAEVVEALSAVTQTCQHTPGELEVLRNIRAKGEYEIIGTLRNLLCGMLLAPAFQLLSSVDLFALPDPLLWDVWPLARYLSRDPTFVEDAAATGELVSYVERLLLSVNHVLAVADERSARYTLGVCILNCLHVRKLLFGDQNLVKFSRLKAQGIERYLSRSGFALALCRARKLHREVKRLAVLVRDVLPNPEGWLLLGMYRGLGRDRFETTLFTVERSAETLAVDGLFDQHISLEGKSIEEAVEIIRALGLDILVLGTFFNGFEKLAAIVAHRLAATQILCAAISPMTTGFRSFDYVISATTTEPKQAQNHYSERLVEMQGPFQCFDFQGVADVNIEPNPLLTQQLLKIPRGAVAIFSGAMQDKIGAQVLNAWGRILQAAPDTILVLYPFAPNWARSYDKAQFLAHLHERFAHFAISKDRLFLLEDLRPHEVRQALSVADLYLDSFPYSGATTVVESLSCGVPAVTVAGKTQRGLQGASWLHTFGLDELVASSEEDYVEKAVRLAIDIDWRTQLRDRIATVLASEPRPYSDFKGFGARFGNVLSQIALVNYATQVSSIA
jgi:Glycosyl transferase family 2/Glycosyl transferase family 41